MVRLSQLRAEEELGAPKSAPTTQQSGHRADSKADPARTPSSAERTARAELDQLCQKPQTDREWERTRWRLVEFARTLVRWDAEQRARSTESKTPTLRHEDRCSHTDQTIQ